MVPQVKHDSNKFQKKIFVLMVPQYIYIYIYIYIYTYFRSSLKKSTEGRTRALKG